MTDVPHIEGEALFRNHTYSTKQGHKVTLAVHQELAEQLDAIGAGKRFMMVLVPLADDEMPDQDAVDRADGVAEGKERVKRAVMLCQDKAFWNWLNGPMQVQPQAQDKEQAAKHMVDFLNIDSRARIKEVEVGARFLRMEEDFLKWAGRVP